MNKKYFIYIILIVFLVLSVIVFFIYNHTSKVEQDMESHFKKIEPVNILSNQAKDARDEILQGPYGQMSPEELVTLVVEAESSYERQNIRLAIVIRKVEVLPVIKEKLQNGSLNEKYKLLMLVQEERLRWPELICYIELIAEDNRLPNSMRIEAAVTLSLFEQKNAIPNIQKLLKATEDNESRRSLIMALAVLGDLDSQDELKALLKDPSPSIQVTAAMCLGVLGNDAGLETAIALSKHDFYGIRFMSAEALSYINTPEALETLHQMKNDDPSISIQEYISEMELAAIEREDLLKKFKEMFNPDNPVSQWSFEEEIAFIYMLHYFGIEAIDILKELSEAEGEFQDLAITALLEINSGIITFPEVRRRNRSDLLELNRVDKINCEEINIQKLPDILIEEEIALEISKSNYAKIQAHTSALRSSAEFYSWENSYSYEGLCFDEESGTKPIIDFIEKIIGTGTLTCMASVDKYCISVNLTDQEDICIDNRGVMFMGDYTYCEDYTCQ